MTRRGSGMAASIGLIAGLLVYALMALAWDGPPAAAQHDDSGPAPAVATAVVFDAMTQLAGASATIKRRGPASPCTWLPTPGRFRCGTEAWAYVGPHAGRSGGRAVRCLWMHPQPGGATTVLRWDKVQVGANVHARAALLKGAGDGKAVSVRVLVDGRKVVSTSVKDEWRRGEADADVPPGAREADVRIEVDAGDNRWRMVCVDVWMSGTRTSGRRGRRPRLDGAGAMRRTPRRLPGLPPQVTPTGAPAGGRRRAR